MSTCANCGTALAGAYCSDCGQRASFHLDLHQFLHDATHEFLHFDSKILRTFRLLLFNVHPGVDQDRRRPAYELIEGSYQRRRFDVFFTGRVLCGEWVLEKIDPDPRHRSWLLAPK